MDDDPMDERPPQQPEGKLIEQTLRQAGLTRRKAAEIINRSESHLRQVINGYTTPRAGRHIPVRARADALAWIAWNLEIAPGELEEAGRPDAAALLREYRGKPPLRATAAAAGDPPGPAWDIAEVRADLLEIAEDFERVGARMQQMVRRLEELERLAGGGTVSPG
ncbi:hypothetical protein [Actinomadura sp. SCN-SB]|uniref:hypothetical protein n=1 Tax=Actinomadura sp. SCN-SB TaxID=3373092 RepID=UPI0037500C33